MRDIPNPVSCYLCCHCSFKIAEVMCFPYVGLQFSCGKKIFTRGGIAANESEMKDGSDE